MLDARIASALNKIIQNSYFKKKGRSGGAESSERRSVPSRKADRLHDLRLLSSPNLWCPGKFVHDVLESFYELRIRESDQLKTVLEVYDMEIHQKISMPDYQKNWKRWWRESTDQKLRLRNFNARSERIETGALVVNRRVQRGVEGGPGECDHWKAKGQCPRGDNCSFRHDEDKRAKSTPKSAPPSEPPTEKDGRSTSRRKCLRGRSPSGKFARQPCRDFIKGKWTRPSCDYWHPPECQCYKFWIGMQIWRKVLVCTKAGWRSTLQKNRKRMWQKCSGYLERCTTVCLRISGHRAAWIIIDFKEERKSLGINSTCASHKCYAASCKHPRKAKVRRSEWVKSKILVSAVRTLQNLKIAMKFEDRSQEETERQERCVRGDAWRLAKKYPTAQRKTQSYLFLTYRGLVSPSAIRNKTGGERIRCRFRSINADVEQERPELCRMGNRKGL